MGDLVQFPHSRMGTREQWITKREVAAYLSVSERWIELRMRDAGFPHHKDAHSRLVRFQLSEIDAWMSRR